MAARQTENLNYRISPKAMRDIGQAANYYEQRRTGLGKAFTDAVANEIMRICANPTTGSVLSRRTRVSKTPRFPYGVVYQHRSDQVFIAVV
jgi:plasmid stabilization system protein ParE